MNVGIGLCFLGNPGRSNVHGNHHVRPADLLHHGGEEQSRLAVPRAKFDDNGRPQRNQYLLIFHISMGDL